MKVRFVLIFWTLVLVFIFLAIGCTDRDSIITIEDSSGDLYFSALRNSDNSVSITFSEAAQDADGGDITKDDFSVAISGGTATLGTNWSLTKSSDTVYILDLDLQGISSGSENVTLNANDDSIYDSLNREIVRIPVTIQLIDLVIPSYEIALEADNAITLTFSEAVINASQSDLTKADIDVTIANGSATLGSAWSVSKTSNTIYSIDLDLQGTPDGDEVVHVNMQANSVFDHGHNLVPSTDETVSLADALHPTFSLLINDDNTATITFSEPVTDESDNDLARSDLSVSITGGVATMGGGWSLTKDSSIVYTIDLDLQAVPNGNEVLHVDVADNSVYDLNDLEVNSSEKTGALLAIDLRLIGPISMNVNSAVTFSATGGSEVGYTYAILSGEGTIDSNTGVFFSGNNVGTTVVRMVDSYLNADSFAVHIGGTGIYAAAGYNGSTMDSVEISFNGIDWDYTDNVLPSSHGEAAMKVYKDKLWFVGGFSNSNDVFESADGINWVNHADVLPTGVDWGATGVYSGTLYYVGSNDDRVYSSDDGSTWTNVGGLSNGSDGGELFIYDDKMWYTYSQSVLWTDDLVDWHAGTLTLPASRALHAGTVFDDKMWLVGGGYAGSTNVWWSTDGDDWHEGEGLTIPDPRGDGEMATFNNRMWYVAGSNNSGYTRTNLSSLDGATWESHTNVMNVNRDRYALEIFTDKTKGPTLATLTFDNNAFANNDLRDCDYKASNDTLFVASFGGGIQITDDNGTSWSAVTTADGLPSNNVYGVFVDRSGNLWAATDAGLGKSADNGSSWTQYTVAEGLPSNSVFDIFVDRSNKIYAATDAGLSISSNGGTSWTNYDAGDGIAVDAINDLFVDFNYNIYLATNAGLSISSDGGSTWSTYTTAAGLGSNLINQVTIGTNGIIYLATEGGVSVSVDSAYSWRNIDTELGLPSNSVQGIHVDNYDIVYVSTDSSGLAISKDGSMTWTDFTTSDGLGSNSPRKITVNDDGTIFIPTSGGGLSIDQ